MSQTYIENITANNKMGKLTHAVLLFTSCYYRQNNNYFKAQNNRCECYADDSSELYSYIARIRSN